jgi:phage shock protein A
MGIFARLSDLITANINALLDQVEDPERMLAQALREMEQALALARRHAAAAIAAERRLARELTQNRARAAHWKEQAQTALAGGREDLARQALACMVEHADLARALEGQHATALETSAEVRGALRALEARLADARRRQRALVARHRAAKVRHELRRAAGAGVLDLSVPFAKFERFENRLIDDEDHLLALAEIGCPAGDLEAEVAALAAKKRIDAELDALERDTQSGTPPVRGS